MKGCSLVQRTSSAYCHTFAPCAPDPFTNSKMLLMARNEGNINTGWALRACFCLAGEALKISPLHRWFHPQVLYKNTMLLRDE